MLVSKQGQLVTLQCDLCGTMRTRRDNGTEPRFCSHSCARRSLPLKRVLDAKGYVLIRVEGNYRKEHRVIMEQHLNRKLRPGEVVHHINRIKTDNRLCNLQLVSISEHSTIHNEEDGPTNQMDPATEAELCSLYDAGCSHQEIALQLNLTSSSVAAKLHRLGLNQRVNKWTPGDISTLVSLYEKGESVTAISAALKRSHTAIRVKCKRLRLSLKGR